ncbi:MAG TPA: hypothetical protein VI815_02615 [Candidatus Nanoarchaeia archaeon]|nr:hypothetical protein [Candidatus Nanoarchaeia archaeon]
MAKLSGLRLSNGETVKQKADAPVESTQIEKTETVVPVEQTKSAVKSLKQVETAPADLKTQKASKGDSIFEKFFEIVSDGKPHKIKDLLDTFSLPHTSSGREKLRQCKRKIETSGGSFKDEIVENAKAISLIIPTEVVAN